MEKLTRFYPHQKVKLPFVKRFQEKISIAVIFFISYLLAQRPSPNDDHCVVTKFQSEGIRQHRNESLLFKHPPWSQAKI